MDCAIMGAGRVVVKKVFPGVICISKTAFLLLSAILVLLNCRVESSEIRVNSLGHPGLIADEEVDIALNPAQLVKLKASQMYAGGAFFNTDFGSKENYYKEENKAVYLGYIAKIGDLGLGIKYEPRTYLFNSNNDSHTYQYTENNLRNFLIHAGFPVSRKVSFGITAGGYSTVFSQKSRSKYWIYEYEEEKDDGIDKQSQVDFGCLLQTSQHTRTGIVISTIFLKHSEETRYISGTMLRLLPAWRLTKRNILNGIIDVKLSKYNFSGRSSNMFALGWNYRHSPTLLLNFSLLSKPLDLIHKYTASSFIQAGIEKEMVKKIKARSSIRRVLGNGRRVNDFAFGIGYDPIKKITIDLSYRKFQNQYYFDDKEFALAGTYRFDDKE